MLAIKKADQSSDDLFEQDIFAATDWFEKAAKKNKPEAFWGLGTIFVANQEFDSAHDYFAKAAFLNEKENNIGVIIDKVEAGITLKDKTDFFIESLKTTSVRGMLVSDLTVQVSGRNRLLSTDTYVIVLPSEKRILYPVLGHLISNPILKEGDQIEIAAKREKDMTINLEFKSNFIFREIKLNEADLPIEMIAPDSDDPEKILTTTSVVLNEKQLAENITFSIISREGRKHLRTLVLIDDQEHVVSPSDVMFR